MGLFDFAIDIGSKINDRIYYDHYGNTKDRSIHGSNVEAVSEFTMGNIAYANRDEEAAKHHTKRAIDSTVKNILK